MKYKPDESTLMAYLYGELEGKEKILVEEYLAASEEAQTQFESLKQVHVIMGQLPDKEVIAPPIVIDTPRQINHWNTKITRVIISIAASMLIIMVVGKLTGTTLQLSNREFKISFGTSPQSIKTPVAIAPATLTSAEVQAMIQTSLQQNNTAFQTSLNETQQRLDASIKNNLASNSTKINTLVHEVSNASQDQVREYVSGIQAENLKMVKDYFQLTSTEQKHYIEDLLVDFSKYLQQQRKDDIMIMQSRLNNIEQNTDMFKQETEQIITSMLTNTKQPTIKN